MMALFCIKYFFEKTLCGIIALGNCLSYDILA